MDKKYIFIDLDGTLVNTSEGIYYALDYCYEKMGLPKMTDLEKNVYIGPPLKVSFVKYGKMTEQQADECYVHFRKAYSEVGVHKHKLYAGIENMVKSLYEMGKTLAVATSKPEKFAKEILVYYGLDKYFTAICGASMDESRVTKKDVLQYAIDKVGATNKNNCVIIGDTSNDVEGAKLVGIDSIGILYGFGNREEFEKSGATEIVETPDDVLKLF